MATIASSSDPIFQRSTLGPLSVRGPASLAGPPSLAAMFLGAVLVGFGVTELVICRSAAMATAAVVVAAIGLVIVTMICRRLLPHVTLDALWVRLQRSMHDVMR